ncbi:hypothetical protein AbraIFM66950_000166 [Aspergillus brasiliensis]|nr:hypothetical protein AbraIFM66950_000166 [Aspergillus brasiliensis]
MDPREFIKQPFRFGIMTKVREKRTGIRAVGRYLFHNRRHKKLRPPDEGIFDITIPESQVERELPTGDTAKLKDVLSETQMYFEAKQLPIPLRLPDVAEPQRQLRIQAANDFLVPPQALEDTDGSPRIRRIEWHRHEDQHSEEERR